MLKISPVLLLGTLLLVLPKGSAFSQQTSLPDAPVNNNSTATEQRRWSSVVQPGEKFVPLNVGDKLLFPLREQLQPISWFPTFASAGWSHLIDGHPKYGTNSAAFGQRLGAAAIRDLSMRTFSDGLLPALLHEDPRYFRMGSGSIPRRGWYAASCVFIGRRDSGATGFNSSVLIGHGMASALTMAYYPDESAKTHVVFQTWGTSLAGEAGGNLWDEFWPDVRNKLFRRHRDPQP